MVILCYEFYFLRDKVKGKEPRKKSQVKRQKEKVVGDS